MPQAEIGAIILALSVTAYLLGKFRTLSSVGLFASILLIGLNGWLITHVAALLGWVQGIAGPAVATVTGISVAAVGAASVCVLGFIVVHDWAPRNSAKKRTFWLSGLLAVLIVAGATPFAALNQLPASISTGVTSVQGG